MKTEQEVREAITKDITRPFISLATCTSGEETVILKKEEVQDLAIIIGKALGVVE